MYWQQTTFLATAVLCVTYTLWSYLALARVGC